ncbi:type 2 lanthipeptide synthetase LanM family protein [Lysinibacillus xylanilyticus]|uniref:type 2 lanthipeptide synthetase LanM family protein n=1 Tax=Lysinibacillus xylanilyticus TaxID=582475 RepID=UPI00380F7393
MQFATLYGITEKKNSEPTKRDSQFEETINLISKGKITEFNNLLKGKFNFDLDDIKKKYNSNDYVKDADSENLEFYIKEVLESKIFNKDNKDNTLNLYSFSRKFSYFFISNISNLTKEILFNTQYVKDVNILKEKLEENFRDKVMKIAYRTLTLEINRLRLERVFSSENENEQFEEYIRDYICTDEYYYVLFDRYPLLFKLIIQEASKTWHYLEFFSESYLKNIGSLKNVLNVIVSHKISHLELGQGDSHNNGQTVIGVHFDNELRCYFKPRDGEIDKLYQNILKEFNRFIGEENFLKSYNLLSNTDHCWVQSVSYSPLSSSSEANEFYYKLGIHMALLYVLNAVDFHSDNLIASGKDPILIDLESLFNVHKNNLIENATNITIFKLNASVRSIGLLPFVFGDNNNTDISGIGRKGETKSFIKIPTIVNQKTSKMSITREYLDIGESKNHPKYMDEYLDETGYIEDVCQGFLKGYTFAKEKRNIIISLVKENISKIKIRHIVKPTMYYSNLLDLSYHPVFMTNQIDREMFFTKLFTDDLDGKVLKEEYNDLINQEVPYFYYYLHKKSLYSSSVNINNEINSYFDNSPLDFWINKVNSLSDQDMKFQISLIKGSLIKEEIKRPSKDQEVDQEFINQLNNFSIDNINNKLIGKSTEIGEYLYSTSDKYKDTYSWICSTVIEHVESKKWHVAAMDDCLYDGLSGMSFYYLWLGKVTGNQRYHNIASSILEDIYQRNRIEVNRSLGAFDGIYSVIYLLINFYKVTGDEIYIKRALNLCENYQDKIKTDKVYDIISGSAGILLVLVELYKCTSSELVKSLMMECKNHLIKNVHTINDKEIGWIGVENNPLSGFSHGSAGIVYALDKYRQLMGDDDLELKEIIEKALYFEEKQREGLIWFDLREHDLNIDYHIPYAWCHGSPGILLSRLSLSKDYNINLSVNNKMIAKDILENGFKRNQSVCHGDLGNAMILKEYSKFTKDEYWSNISKVIAGMIVENREPSDYRLGLGLELDVETPELMVGLSGIAYALLFLSSDEVPNILILET